MKNVDKISQHFLDTNEKYFRITNAKETLTVPIFINNGNEAHKCSKYCNHLYSCSVMPDG